MRTRTLTVPLAALALIGGLTACADSDPGTHTEPTKAEAPSNAPKAQGVSPEKAKQADEDQASGSDDYLQVADLEEFFAENGQEFYGEQFHEDLSVGLCALLEETTPGGAWRAQVEAYTPPDDAVFNVMVATAYCPEQTPAVVEWVKVSGDLAEAAS